MNNFEFSPKDGLMNKNTFPTNLGSETEARQQFMTLFNQLKDYNNSTVKVELENNKKATLTPNGYQKLASGLIIQWGKVKLGLTNETRNSVSVNFPIQFPNGVFFIGANLSATVTGIYAFNELKSNSQCEVYVCSTIGNITLNSSNVYWIALGY